jgi:twinkle protein
MLSLTDAETGKSGGITLGSVESNFLKHIPCNNCGSSDANSLYDDGHQFCHVCHTRIAAPRATMEDMEGLGIYLNKQTQQRGSMQVLEVFKNTEAVHVAERGISKATMHFFGAGSDGKNYYFPYCDAAGKMVAAKTRSMTEKQFSVQGDWKSATMFGQSKFTPGGRAITITEGEFDALAAYQLTGSRFPVVSVRNGASAALKDCRASYEYLDSFEKIVICFDNDEPGQQAANQVAELFGAKAHIFKYPTKDLKDACDYLSTSKTKEFVDTWWNAEKYVPDGIVSGSTLWDLVNQAEEKAEVMYPYEGINDLTYGIRLGELVTVTAGSGLGKSQFLREIVWQILSKTEDNIGLMFLEESVKKTAKSLMALAANKPLHLPDCEATDEDIKDAFNRTLGTDRLYLFDHFGSTSVDNIVNRVRFMARGLDCKYVFVDHVSIIVSAQESGDERKAIDEIMTKLRMLVQETGISLFVVSHLKRPESKGHEEGAATSLAQLRGSGAIAQLSDMVIGLERNGQHTDAMERNTTYVRILKNRFSGLTGLACRLLYNRMTGRMSELPPEENNL